MSAASWQPAPAGKLTLLRPKETSRSVEGAAAIVERLDPGNEALLSHIIEGHTRAEDVGRVAARARVKSET